MDQWELSEAVQWCGQGLRGLVGAEEVVLGCRVGEEEVDPGKGGRTDKAWRVVAPVPRPSFPSLPSPLRILGSSGSSI